MNEEITNESVEPVETTPEVEAEAPAPSLDEIAKEFSVEDEANQFQAQPTQPAPAQPQYQPSMEHQNTDPGIPDPTYDPDGYSRYMQQQAQQTNQINQALSELANKVSTYEEQMARQKVEADLSNAVSRVNTKLNVDPMLAETALETEYRTNPTFQKIWQNREKNPKAFEKALDIVADKWTGVFVNRSNDQLVENVRAAKTSQQTLATAPKHDPNAEVGQMSEAEFERWWSTKKG